MKREQRFYLLSFLAAIVVFSLVFVIAPRSGQTARRNTIALQAPVFVQAAHAQEQTNEFDIAAYLDQEAGISAYFKSSFPITISQVRSAYRTIEIETTDYIIGSVQVPNYMENFDVHVYVHKDGWILAYYLKDDPTSKIIDVKGPTINSTILKTVVAVVASAAGAPFTDITYYDFRYPNATNLLLVAEDGANGNSFTITVPSSYAYFERSWSHRYYCDIWFDTTYNPNIVWQGDNQCYGTLTASQILPDVQHTITVRNGWDGTGNYGVLVITYRVP